MISQTYWTILEHANRDLLMCFEKVKKRANGDPEGIKQARMEYIKALQILPTRRVPYHSRCVLSLSRLLQLVGVRWFKFINRI